MFAYFETIAVEYNGLIKPIGILMRCDMDRHPVLRYVYYEGSLYMPDLAKKCPTRLAHNKKMNDHDDWDCADDLVECGLLKHAECSTGIHPAFRLTEQGHIMIARLRKAKADGISFSQFADSLSVPVFNEQVVAKSSRCYAYHQLSTNQNKGATQ